MPPDARLHRLAALVFLCLSSLTLPAQEGKSDSKDKTKASDKTATAAEATPETPGSQLTTFGRQIPAQRPNRGIWIPSFSGGLLSSVVEADVVTRIDDQRLFAENMTILLHGSEDKDQVKVDMPSATYHMTSQMIRSNERSKVSRADFDLEGDSLVFDTTTSQGRMSGNVRMTIHDAKSFLKVKPDTTSTTHAATNADPKKPAAGTPAPQAPAQTPAPSQP